MIRILIAFVILGILGYGWVASGFQLSGSSYVLKGATLAAGAIALFWFAFWIGYREDELCADNNEDPFFLSIGLCVAFIFGAGLKTANTVGFIPGISLALTLIVLAFLASLAGAFASQVMKPGTPRLPAR